VRDTREEGIDQNPKSMGLFEKPPKNDDGFEGGGGRGEM
jgi:hypothetical protein